MVYMDPLVGKNGAILSRDVGCGLEPSTQCRRRYYGIKRRLRIKRISVLAIGRGEADFQIVIHNFLKELSAF